MNKIVWAFLAVLGFASIGCSQPTEGMARVAIQESYKKRCEEVSYIHVSEVVKEEEEVIAHYDLSATCNGRGIGGSDRAHLKRTGFRWNVTNLADHKGVGRVGTMF
jgi:hypothetical protein